MESLINSSKKINKKLEAHLKKNEIKVLKEEDEEELCDQNILLVTKSSFEESLKGATAASSDSHQSKDQAFQVLTDEIRKNKNLEVRKGTFNFKIKI